VKSAGQGCDFHGSSAAIPGTPSCVFVMRHILLTKRLLQAHSDVDKRNEEDYLNKDQNDKIFK
jgi:hypothetical protein